MTTKILLVEDDAGALNSLAQDLSLAGFGVMPCESSQKAIDILAGTPDTYQLIILDWMLDTPEGSSQVIEKARGIHPSFPVIVITGDPNYSSPRAIQKGASWYIRKPFTWQELETIIRDLMAQDAIFHSVAQTAKDLMGSDQCLIWRYYEQKRELKLTAWAESSSITEIDKATILSADESKLKRILQDENPTFIKNIQQSSYYYSHKLAEQHKWDSVICVPLRYQGERIGLLEGYYIGGWKFPDNQRPAVEKMAKIFADQAAESIYNSELAHKNRELINSLSSLSAEQLTLDALAGAILSKGIDLAEAEVGGLYLCNFEKEELRLTGKGSQYPNKFPKRIKMQEDNIASLATREGAIRIIEDAEVTPKITPLLVIEYRSQIAIPLKRGELVIGTLVLASQHANAFSESDIAVARSFSTLAGSALDQAKLRMHLQRISQAVLKSHETLQRAVIQAINDMIGKSVALWLWNDEMTELVVPVAIGVGDDFKKRAKIKYTGIDDSLIAHTFLTKQPLNCADIRNPGENTQVKLDSLLEKEKWLATLIVPIFDDSKEQPIGAVALKRNRVGKFNQYEVDFLSNFANQVAIAFENHRRGKGLEQLVKSGQITSEQVKGEKEVLDRFVKMACELTGASCSVIYPYNPERKTFFETEKIASYGLIYPEKKFKEIPRYGGVAYFIRKVGQVIVDDLDLGKIRSIDFSSFVSPDPTNEKELRDKIRAGHFIEREQIKAFIGLSLRATETWGGQDEERELGVLYVNYRIPHRFSSSEIDLIRLFANQVGSAIQSVRLNTSLKEQIDRLESLVEIGNTLSKISSKSRVINTVVNAVLRILRCTHCTYFALEGKKLVPVESYSLGNSKKIDRCFDLGEGLAGWVAKEGKPIFAPDAKSDPRFIEGNQSPRVERSLIVVPVRNGETVVGVISADQDQANFFSEREVHWLEILALQTEVAIENGELLERMNLLQDVSTAISAASNIQDTLKLIVGGAIKLTATESGVIHLINADKQKIDQSYGYPEGGSHISSRFSRKVGLTWEVFRTGEVVSIPDITKNKLVNKELSRSGIRAVIGVPLKSEGKTIGVLFLNDAQIHDFSERERQLLTTLTNNAAIAIVKSKANDQRVKDITALQEIVGAIGSADKDPLPLIIKKAADLFDADYGSFALVDRANESVNYKAIWEKGKTLVGRQIPIAKRQQSLKIGIVGQVASSGEVCYAPDLSEPSSYKKWYNDSRSELAAPLKDSRGNVIGVLNLESISFDAFSVSQQELCLSLAQVAAEVVEKAKLFETTQELNVQFEALHNVVQEKDLLKALQQIVGGVNKALGPETCTCSIAQYDEKDEKFILPVVATGPLAEMLRIPPREKEGMGWYVLDKKEPLFIENVEYMPVGAPDLNPDLIKAGICSTIALPLIRHEHKMGVLFIHQRQLAVFSTELQTLLKTYAHQAAIAIENARQYKQRGEDIAALRSINEAVVASKGLDEILNLIVKKAVEVMPAEYSSLWLGDPLTGGLIFEARYCDFPSEINLSPGQLVVSTPSVNMRVYKTGKYIKLDDVNQETQGFHRIYKPARSELAVPMKYQGQIIGTLNVESRFPAAFSDENATLLESFAAQAAIAIESARIVSRLKVANKVSHELLNGLWNDEKDIFRLIKEESSRFMDTGNFFIASYQERTKEVSFPFAYVNGQKVDIAAPDSLWKPRRDGHGLTEEVIYAKKYILMKTKEEQLEWYRERGVNYIGKTFASWLGVPLLHGDRVIGVIATYHETEEHKYGEDDAQILSVIADSLALAWKNTREVAALQTLSNDLLRLTASFWEQEPSTDGRGA